MKVVAAVIRKEDRYLLCQRPFDKEHGGLWEFPGGKVGKGEKSFDALERELEEELGVESKPLSVTADIPAKDRDLTISFIET